ncbi:hypothetical protein [Paenibacillus caui]|uniref:hypothetical protein n=1 Tax=Paenibacillus caui TaxID=2873927 RepID=UPI001CA9E322|nr:hypothetical protein [Paenibacillus caui]
MAFGVNRRQLNNWKDQVTSGQIAFLTHYWLDPRFPDAKTVTKVGCSDLERLTAWCLDNELNPKYIHRRQPYPHFDLIGAKQKEILVKEGLQEQIEQFGL